MKKLFFTLLLLLPAPALPCKITQGQFATPTVTGNQTVDTGVDSVLKAIRFYGSLQTAEGFAQGQSNFHGMAVSSTARKVLAWASDDNVATSNTGKKSANLCICLLTNGTPTVDGEADFVSFGTGVDAGKFTINWTDAPASAWLIYYEAYYGANLTNANVTEHAYATGTGSESETGIGFQPDFIFFMSSQQTVLGTAGSANVGLGMAAGAAECGSVAVCAPDGDGAGGYNARTYQGSSYRHLVCFDNTTAASIGIVDSFVSFDADGYTHQKITNSVANALVWCLSLKGGSYDVGSFNSPTAGGTPQDQSVTTNFRPSGVSFLSGTSTTLNANIATHQQGLGAGNDSSGTISEQSAWSFVDNVTNVTITGMRDVSTKSITHGISGDPPTVNAEADYKTQAATSFTVTWTTIAAAAHKTYYTAFGPGDEPGGAVPNIRRQRILRSELLEEEDEKSPLGFFVCSVAP